MKIGDKVVCIVDFNKAINLQSHFPYITELPKQGIIYVVREIRKELYNTVGILLIGIKSKELRPNYEMSFAIEGFKLLEEIQAENKEKQREKEELFSFNPS